MYYDELKILYKIHIYLKLDDNFKVRGLPQFNHNNHRSIRRIIHILIGLFIGMNSYQVVAQSTPIDSAISLLQAGVKHGKVDTVLLQKIRLLIRRDTITESNVQQLVEEANRYRTGDDEDMSFSICYLVLQALNNRRNNAKINFGNLMLQRIEKSKSPEKKYFINLFLSDLRGAYRNSTHLEEGIQLYNNYLIRFTEKNDSFGMATCHFVLGGFYRAIGLFDRAIYYIKKSMADLDSSKPSGKTYFGGQKTDGRGGWINNMGVLPEYFGLTGDHATAIKYALLYLKLHKENTNADHPLALQRLANSYLRADRLDSALYFVRQAYDSCKANTQWVLASVFQTWSVLELRNGNYRKADSLIVECWKGVRKNNQSAFGNGGIVHPDYYRALIYAAEKKYGEAAGFLLNDIVRVRNLRNELLTDYKLLGEVYEKMGDIGKSKDYYKSFISLQDSLLNDQNKYSTISFEVEQQMNEKEISINQLKSENKISTLTRNFSFGIIALVVLLAGLIYYRYRTKQKANLVLEKTLTHLQSTQQQLIQSEKMASLGELTAGIAHEIQNPLNFVNNFSEVNNELIEEVKSRSLSGQKEKLNNEELDSLLDQIYQNNDRISHHGKRADSIVKGMLQHSRTSNGIKQPTDINALADEYLRLAYHGLRAKDNLFNATLKTDFNDSIAPINIIPQDIARVLLNVFNNAFYAVSGKPDPTVSISTKKVNGTVEIKVQDNGNGIPQNVVDKIFQPFFTTKPTGEGTGLGLSMSYDIVKAHGGEMKVETREGNGCSFLISLPYHLL
jgi:signal transduction histidine kinase